MTKEEAPHFIQFIRELSIGCRKNQLVLSVDDPVPEFTTYYNRKEQGIVADYVIIMGYDEHTEGSEKAGSVASLPFVEKGITQTLKFSSDFVKLNEITKEKEKTEQLLEEKMERWEYLEELAAKIAEQ